MRYKLNTTKPCNCEEYDQRVGAVIIILKNLQTLHFSCHLCRRYGRHSYLLDAMQTRKLQEFHFSCWCLTPPRQIDTKPTPTSLLTAPHMQTVTTLLLQCSNRWLVDKSGTVRAILQNPVVLPRVTSLYYGVYSASGRLELPSDLLTARAISRLFCRGSSIIFPVGLRPAHRPEHLMFWDVLAWLPSASIQDLNLCANLRFLGTFTLRSSKVRRTFCVVTLSNL